MTSEVESYLTPDLESSGISIEQETEPKSGVGLRSEDIEQTLSDVESIIGEPLKKRRGRKRKSETEEAAPIPPVFDAAQIQDTLVGIYIQLVGALSRAPVVITPEQKEGVGPLIAYCANQYIPGDASKHLPGVALIMVTLEIVRQSRNAAKKESNE